MYVFIYLFIYSFISYYFCYFTFACYIYLFYYFSIYLFHSSKHGKQDKQSNKQDKQSNKQDKKSDKQDKKSDKQDKQSDKQDKQSDKHRERPHSSSKHSSTSFSPGAVGGGYALYQGYMRTGCMKTKVVRGLRLGEDWGWARTGFVQGLRFCKDCWCYTKIRL